MIRRTPLKRSRLKRKPRRGDNPTLRHEWASEHLACACCGTTRGFIHVHHILGGAYGRPDHKANLLSLCVDCHSLAHAGKLTRAMQLSLKIETDRDWYDPLWMQERMGRRRLEEPVPVPEQLRERR